MTLGQGLGPIDLCFSAMIADSIKIQLTYKELKY